MRVEDLRERLLADPKTDDPGVLEAKNASLEHRRVVREVEAFENKLERALAPSETAARAEDIIGALPESGGGRFRWLAVAASLAVAALLVVVVGDQLETRFDPVRTAMVEHFMYDEPGALASSEPLDLAEAIRYLDEVDAHLPGDHQLTYAKRCVIGGERGLHLVLTDQSNNKTSVLYMPADDVRPGQLDVPGNPSAELVAAGEGAVAVFTHGDQSLDSMVDGLFGTANAVSMLF